ncbi:hypothetical protein [Corynebacterium occultum]|uniref:hypothetical protein n=1 Tax=Corynebacterium occultum TaxID=2675219 RepID=UPI0012E2DD05|nr:hypothetical protein [Corynebacterium occultum]
MLSHLAHMDVSPEKVLVSIDTGHLSWPESLHPEATEFIGYQGEEHYGVQLDEVEVAFIDGRPLTCLPMRTAAGDPLNLWVHELAEEPGEQLDGFELVTTARGLMEGWCSLSLNESMVVIPALQMSYHAEIHGLGVPTQQRFVIALDESGARVITEVLMCTGVPDFEAQPEPVVFGVCGPLMMWFSEKGADLPFTVQVSSGAAWLEPGQEVDLHGLDTPPCQDISPWMGPEISGQRSH